MNEAVPPEKLTSQIFMPTSLQIDVEQSFRLYRHYFEPYLSSHTLSKLKCYAITLTIPENTAKYIREKNAKVIDYFHFLLKTHKMEGVYVCEYTKKGVEHIHGVVYSNIIAEYKKTQIKSKGNFTYTYTHPTYPYEHQIKEITTNLAFTGWMKYCTKHLIHPNVIEFFNLS